MDRLRRGRQGSVAAHPRFCPRAPLASSAPPVSAQNNFNRDYLAETPEGDQRPMLNVFHREGGVVRHFWGSELFDAPTEPGQDPRHVGLLEPVWNLFDLTPEGRPDWDEQLVYP